MKEYILCAAIYFKDGKIYEHQPKNIGLGYVICGRRHHNCYMTKWIFNEDHIENIQGFLTNLDRFVDRKESYKIAKAANQIITKCDKDERELFSEDLY